MWSNRRDNLRGVTGGLEEIILERPAAGQMNADATGCFADAHPTITYTLEEAADLISNVKAFMNELVQVI